MLSLVSHSEYADGRDRQTDGCQRVTLCFALDVANIITVSVHVWQLTNIFKIYQELKTTKCIKFYVNLIYAQDKHEL